MFELILMIIKTATILFLLKISSSRIKRILEDKDLNQETRHDIKKIYVPIYITLVLVIAVNCVLMIKLIME